MYEDLFLVVRLDTQGTTTAPINVVMLLRDIINKYSQQIRKSEIQLHMDVSCTDTCTILGDTSYLSRAISNILDNAIQYGDNDTEISLSANGYDNTVEIIIRNQGMTIPDEQIPYVFDYFFRGEAHRSLDNDNIGMGLTIANKVVNTLNGTITIENENDAGVRVTISLPCVTRKSDELTSTYAS